MIVYSAQFARVTPIFCDLDAKELLMLYGMMERAAARANIAAACGILNGLDASALITDFQTIATLSYDAAMKRVASISVSDEYFAWMPSRGQWKNDPIEPLF